MGDTVSNEKKTICTKGSSHTAKHTFPDICFLPSWIPNGFENSVPTERATAGVTVKTFIQNKPVVVSVTLIGPPSDAAHPGINKGVLSRTYRMEAVATDFSKDVFLESFPVVRTGDPTTQNHRNTKGAIIAGNYTASAESIEDQMKKKCVITEFKAVCSGGGDDKHGRSLGWPGAKGSGEPFYLEVKSEDIVKFESVRKDISKEPNAIEPTCQQGGKHTQWEARAIQHPLQTEEVLEKNGPKFEVPAIMALNTIVLKLLGYKAGEDQGHEEEMEQDTTRPEKEPDWKKRKEDVANGPGTAAEREAATKAINKEMNAYQKANGRSSKVNPKWSDWKLDKSVGEAIAVNSREIITFWLWRAAPPTIKVKALSCGATRNAELKVFPVKKWEFELKFDREKAKGVGYRDSQAAAQKAKKESDHFDQIITTLTGIKKVCTVASRIATLAGEKLEIKFLVGFHVKLEIKYVECTETKGYWPNSQYTPARVNRDWTLIIGAKPFLGVDFSTNIPLINFVVPCIGKFVGDMLRRAGIVRADLVFSAIIGFYGNVQFGQDEYDFPKGVAVELGIDVTLAASLVIGAAGIDLVEVKIAFPAVFKAIFETSKKPGSLAQMTPKGQIQCNISLTFFPDRWWEIEGGYWEPESLKFQFKGEPWPLFPSPG